MKIEMQKIIIIFLFTLLCGQNNIWASTPASYRQRIQEVNESVSNLIYPEENLTEEENIATQHGVLKDIRLKLPLTEKIEIRGAAFEVRHDWIWEKLKDFEGESYRSEKRRQIVLELSERLSALASKLGELENQTSSGRTKDEEKQKLEEILKRPEYQKPVNEETWLQRKWREFWEWLWRTTPKTQRQSQEQTGSPLISTSLLYIVIGAALLLLGFLMYRFAPFLARRLRDWEREEKNSRIILGEVIAAEETSHNIFAEAEVLARSGNLRGAIRKGYIALLCELSDRKVIGLARHKTNRDYLRDVRQRKNLHQNMSRLTSNFERNWYGLKKTGEDDWEEFKQDYQEAINSRG